MPFNEKEFEILVLGALFHDIGKLVQRANENPTLKKHTEWGYEWLNTHFPGHPANLATIAHHHMEDDDYALNNNRGLIWYQADNLSAKERKEKDKEKLEEGKWHSEIAMASPFSRINNPQNTGESPPLTYLPLKSEGIPFTLTEEPSYSNKEYKEILCQLEQDLESQTFENRASVNFLLAVFEKYLKSVPAITLKIYDGLKKEEIKDKHPDISLFDHLKLTAAIAGCMYHYYSTEYSMKWERNELLKEEILNVPKDKRPYLLVGGDISGVQKFIYTITSKGALKSLKGRSFFVELLLEHTVSEVIDRLKLTRCNIIFMGGGAFYVLSHNTPHAVKILEQIRSEINSFLFEEFRGSLFLNLEYVDFHPDDFDRCMDLWPRLSKRIEDSKKRKWIDRIDEAISVSMPHKDCLTGYCEVCFREDVTLEPVFSASERIYEHVCKSCGQQYQLGDALKKVSRQKNEVLYCFDAQSVPRDRDKAFAIGNSFYLFTTRSRELDATAKRVYLFNDLDAKNYTSPNCVYMPLGIFQHKDIVELSNASKVFGINRLAVLRMDVDYLGKIFSEAIPEEHRTFSRMASISRALNDFFKYYLNVILSCDNKKGGFWPTNLAGRPLFEGRKLTVVYSGGDDLFIVGHWLEVIESAMDIEICFKRYTGNPFVTISGGVSINHSKFPIYQYAREAGEAEEEAKNFEDEHEEKQKKKDAITFFRGMPMRWSDVERLRERVHLFVKFLIRKEDHLAIDEKSLPKTFFHRVLALARRFNDEGVLVLPKAAYLLSRANFGMAEPETILKFKDAIMTSNAKEWKITELSTLLTLMLMRKGGEENEG